MIKKYISKEVFSSLLFLFILTNVYAQPELIKIDNFFNVGNPDELLVFTDSENPITDSKCRILLSELTVGKRGLWSRYHFEDVPKEGKWYKDFVFFKCTTPSSSYFSEHPERRALYDVVNKHYFSYAEIDSEKQYIKMCEGYDDSVKPDLYFELYTTKDNTVIFDSYDTYYKEYFIPCSKVYDGINYLELKRQDAKDLNPLSVYCFKNTDFINEDIPDKNINTEANYLFLQRNYKLGQTYNSVIFPVDIPLYDYHHAYNDGMNRMIVYRLQAIDSNSLNFVRDDSGVLKANTPYIIKSQKEDNTTPDQILSEYYLSETPVDHYDINCKKVVLTENNVDVYAQYKKSIVQYNDRISPDEDIFVISNNKLINCRNIEKATVNRFRWYIKRPRNENAKPMTIYIDGVTEIENVEDDTAETGTVYDLNGIALCKMNEMNTLKKGYYIVNGKVRLLGD